MSNAYISRGIFDVVVFLLFSLSYNVRAVSVKEYLSLTFSEKNELDKFRLKVQPLLEDGYMQHDTYLIRWLRAQNFDINAAEKMLRENLQWRKENSIDTMRTEDWSDMSPDFHVTIDTYDKTGRPGIDKFDYLVGVMDISDWDIRRAILQGKGPRLFRFVINLVENITGQMYERQERGMNVTQVVVLGTAEGFNLITHGCPACIPYWVQFVQVIENYYPDVLDELIIIDAPPTIQVVLKAVLPFLRRSTRDAIRVFSPNKNKWLQYLDSKIIREERRQQYGGTKPAFKY